MEVAMKIWVLSGVLVFFPLMSLAKTPSLTSAERWKRVGQCQAKPEDQRIQCADWLNPEGLKLNPNEQFAVNQQYAHNLRICRAMGASYVPEFSSQKEIEQEHVLCAVDKTLSFLKNKYDSEHFTRAEKLALVQKCRSAEEAARWPCLYKEIYKLDGFFY